MIIGDDASGRIPALVMWHTRKDIYVRHGYSPPLLRFVAGGAGRSVNSKEELNKHVERMKNDSTQATAETGKALIVTDTIFTGGSLNHLLQDMKNLQWGFDIATIGTLDKNRMLEMEKEYGTKVVWGVIGTPDIYKMRPPGVYKEKGADIIARAHYRKFGQSSTSQNPINEARQYVQEHIVPKVVAAYIKTHPPGS